MQTNPPKNKTELNQSKLNKTEQTEQTVKHHNT
jgi:hypothetical protein